MVDVVSPSGEEGLDRQLVDTHDVAEKPRQLRRELSDVAGLNPAAVHQAGNLYDAAFGEVRDQAVIAHVAVDHRWFACLVGVDDVRAVLV